MHLGIIKITYNRTATHFRDERFVNLGEKVILTLWQSGTSESATVCFVISLSICCWLLKCRVLRILCVCVCSCVCERETRSHNRGLCANASLDSVSLSDLNWWIKLRTLLTVCTFSLKAKARDYGKGVTFLTRVVQSRLCLSEGGTL